jgi:hypothetical protein
MNTVYIEITVNGNATFAMYQGMDEAVAISLASELGTNVRVITQEKYNSENQRLNSLKAQNVAN